MKIKVNYKHGIKILSIKIYKMYKMKTGVRENNKCVALRTSPKGLLCK